MKLLVEGLTAWAGTVANVLLALVVAVGAGTQWFHQANREHARALLAMLCSRNRCGPDADLFRRHRPEWLGPAVTILEAFKIVQVLFS